MKISCIHIKLNDGAWIANGIASLPYCFCGNLSFAFLMCVFMKNIKTSLSDINGLKNFSWIYLDSCIKQMMSSSHSHEYLCFWSLIIDLKLVPSRLSQIFKFRCTWVLVLTCGRYLSGYFFKKNEFTFRSYHVKPTNVRASFNNMLHNPFTTKSVQQKHSLINAHGAFVYLSRAVKNMR